jgi:lysophospholipase L1-like esterase
MVYLPASALPEGQVIMIAIGDSLTQGDGDETGRGYPGRILEMVNAIRPGSSITNFGQSGWSSDALINGDQGLPGQVNRAIAEVQAASQQNLSSVVFVWIGSNDLWYLYEYGGDVNDDAEAQDLQRFTSNLDVILAGLRQSGAQVIIALLDDQSKRPVALNGEAFTSITADELDRMSVQVQRYNEAISQKAEKYGALTVDFYSTDIFTNRATLYDDGNHPNQAGYDLISQKWFEALSLILK